MLPISKSSLVVLDKKIAPDAVSRKSSVVRNICSQILMNLHAHGMQEDVSTSNEVCNETQTGLNNKHCHNKEDKIS